MDDSIKTIFKEQFQKLPPELRKAVTANDLRTKLTALTLKYRLHIDKAGILENEVVLVLMGMEDPEAFVTNVRRELGVSDEDARSLARDVNDQIFHPIRESLETFINQQGEQYATENPTAEGAGTSLGAPVVKAPVISTPMPMPEAPKNVSRPTPPAATIPSAPQSTGAVSGVVIGTPRRVAPTGVNTVSQPSTPPVQQSNPISPNLPEKIVEPLPAVQSNIQKDITRDLPKAIPKDIVAEKLQPISLKSVLGSVPTPKMETPAPSTEAATIRMKSFGVQIDLGKGNATPNGVSSLPPTPASGTINSSPAPNTPSAPKSTTDPYREPV